MIAMAALLAYFGFFAFIGLYAWIPMIKERRRKKREHS